MIDTFMALWNRNQERRKRVLFIVSALFLIGMSLSLLLATLGHLWSSHGNQPGITSEESFGTTSPTGIVITTMTTMPTTTVWQNCLPSPTSTTNKVPTQPGDVNVQGGSRGSEPTASPVTQPVQPTSTVTQKPSATPTTAQQPESTPTLPPTLTPLPTVTPIPVLQLTPTPTLTVVPSTPTLTPVPLPTTTVTPIPTLTPAPLSTATSTPTIMVTPSPTIVTSPTVTAPAVSPTASVTTTMTATATVEGNQQQGSEFSGGGGGVPAGSQATAAAGNGWISNCSSNQPIKSKSQMAIADTRKNVFGN